MRQPSILDVLRAVRQISPAHPEVRAWWYAPARRFRLRGALSEGEGSTVEVVVDLDSQGADLAAIGGELGQSLGGGGPVVVRPHRGMGEEGQLYRLLSQGKLVRVG